jgi:hypothetical protein
MIKPGMNMVGIVKGHYDEGKELALAKNGKESRHT